MNILIIPSAELSYNSGSVIFAKELYKHLISQNNNVYMLGNCLPEDLPSQYQANIIIKRHLLFHPIIDDRPVSNEQHFLMLRDLIDGINQVIQRAKKSYSCSR